MPAEPAPIEPEVLQALPNARGNPRQTTVIAVIAAGGAMGTLARYGVGLTMPTRTGSFPIATLLINVVGCLLLGVVAEMLAERERPLLRPFLGTGVLGGFTTFSTFAVETRALIADGRPATGALYVGITAVTALVAAWAGLRLGRAAP